MGLKEAKISRSAVVRSVDDQHRHGAQSEPNHDLRSADFGVDREERLKALASSHQQKAENYYATLLNSHRYAPANHPCVQELSKTVRWAAEQLGMPPDSVSIHVFKAYPYATANEADTMFQLEAHLPEAFVLTRTGAIFVNTQLLEGLSWSRSLVNAVLYHEVAHLQFKRSLLEQVSLSINDPITSHSESYEVEYHCDRLAALLSSLRGEDPKSVSLALQALEDTRRNIIENSDVDTASITNPEFVILSTHPERGRRIRANTLVARNLPHPNSSSDSTLPEVKDAEMPVRRPFGNVINEENSVGLDDDLISKGDIDPPMEFRSLLEAAQKLNGEGEFESKSDLVSDWFMNLHAFLTSDADSEQFKTEFAAELRGVPGLPPATRDELREVLETINVARFLPNDQLSNFELVWAEFGADFPISLDLLVSRYIEIARQEQSPLEVLSDLVQIGHRGDRRFGIGIVFCGNEIGRLCADIARTGSEEEKRALIALIDSSPHLLLCSYMLDEGESHVLQALIKERSKTNTVGSEDTQLDAALRAYTLEKWLKPALSSQDPCELPICVRREPGATFRVERQSLRNGREYELVTIGDQPLGESEEATLREHLTRSVNEGLQQLALRQDIPLTAFSANKKRYTTDIPARISGIQSAAKELFLLEPKTDSEKRAYVKESFAQDFKAEVDNRTRQSRNIADSATLDDWAHVNFIADLGLRVQLEGEQSVENDFLKEGRSSFSQARYARIEERSTLHLQHERLWRELYAEAHTSMPSGLSKAQFLTSTYPVKTLYRDQLICESLELPALSYLDDIKTVAGSIKIEDSIDTLLFLRDSFRNQALAQMVETRLFEIFETQPKAFLEHPTIQASRAEMLGSLPEILQTLIVSEDRLLGILSCFSFASRERDRHLVEFRDRANDRAKKEALGVLFSDPNLASTSGNVEFQARQHADAVFSVLSHLSPYDRAQTILYFMGQRSFNSPIENWLHEGGSPFGNESTDISPQKGLPRYRMPDALVRAQKAFGIAVETAENLQGGLLNERTITDLLDEALSGTNGITSAPEISKQFFRLAGRILIRENPQLADLPLDQREKVEKFVAFAFEQCPVNRLPSVILKVWEASKGDNKDMPTLAATILGKLGPAFVKFGQRLSALDIDEGYKRAFRKLCSENAQVDTSFVYHNLRVICPPETFDESRTGRKIAEGSMAATFQGALRRSGEEVAVKVIHPHIRGDIDEDSIYIRKIVRYLNKERPFPRLVIPQNTPEIIRHQLSTQVDSSLEMKRADQLRGALKGETAMARFVVPEVKLKDSGDGAIVFSFMPSYELDSPTIDQQGVNAQAIRNTVGLEVLRMLLEERCFQSDVNLGNFGVLKDSNNGKILLDNKGLPTVVWYDPGAVEEISSSDQRLLLNVLKAATQEPQRIPELVSQMVQGVEGQEEKVRRVCAEFGDKLKSGSAIALTSLQDHFNEFFDDLSRAGCLVQDRWLVIANTLSMAAPLLSGVSEKQITDLVVNAMKKHKVLSAAEGLALTFRALWR